MSDEPKPGQSGTKPLAPIQQAGRLFAESPQSTIGLMLGVKAEEPTAQVRTESGSARRWWQFWKSNSGTPENPLITNTPNPAAQPTSPPVKP